jgi:hypothetical protein
MPINVTTTIDVGQVSEAGDHGYSMACFADVNFPVIASLLYFSSNVTIAG